MASHFFFLSLSLFGTGEDLSFGFTNSFANWVNPSPVTELIFFISRYVGETSRRSATGAWSTSWKFYLQTTDESYYMWCYQRPKSVGFRLGFGEVCHHSPTFVPSSVGQSSISAGPTDWGPKFKGSLCCVFIALLGTTFSSSLLLVVQEAESE